MLGVNIAYKDRRQAAIVFDTNVSGNIKVTKDAFCCLEILPAGVNYKFAKL